MEIEWDKVRELYLPDDHNTVTLEWRPFGYHEGEIISPLELDRAVEEAARETDRQLDGK